MKSKTKLVIMIALGVLAIVSIVFATYQQNPYTAGETAGTEVSSTYEGRHITILESELIHPSHTDGFVDKGDQICFSDDDSSPTLVGVALMDADAATDYVSIDTEGIWNLTVDNSAAMYIGDPVFIDPDNDAALTDTVTNVAFGWCLSDKAQTDSAVIPIKVHPEVNFD